MLQWLWCRLAAVVMIQLLVWEPSCAKGAALKSKKKKKERKKERKENVGEIVEKLQNTLLVEM